ncbi:MAG: TRAP transporter substrate-binding protein [Rhodothalassiaceae bacterium]
MSENADGDVSSIGLPVSAAALLILLGLVAAMRYGPSPEPALDLSLPWGAGEYHSRNAARFAATVARETEGRVRIRVHSGAALGIKGPDSLRALADDVLPLIEFGGFQQIGLEPLFGLEALPFLVRDEEELALLHRALRPLLTERLAKRGIVLLYQVPWPPQNIFARVPIGEAADLRGLVVRTLDANTTDLAVLLGMLPVQLASADIVPQLATRRLDAVMTSTTTAAAQHYERFLRHVLRSNHGWLTNYLGMSRRAFEALSPEDRTILLATARRLEREFHEVARADDLAKLAQLEAAGMIVHRLDAESRARLEARARPLWLAFVRRVPESRDILAAYLAATGRAPLEEERS